PSALTDNPLQVLPAHCGSNPYQQTIQRLKQKNLTSPSGAISGFACCRSNNPFKPSELQRSVSEKDCYARKFKTQIARV
ncbi:hypothetical protein, partial [Serratia marcescens]|uniref:hypothetical protein n=1 Tax=Serratia marcescens TaxID=615 RepID=UPI001952EE87